MTKQSKTREIDPDYLARKNKDKKKAIIIRKKRNDKKQIISPKPK